MKDIGRFKGGTGCQENQEKDRCQIVVVHDLFIYLFILRSNAGSGDAHRHSAPRSCRHEAGSLY